MRKKGVPKGNWKHSDQEKRTRVSWEELEGVLSPRVRYVTLSDPFSRLPFSVCFPSWEMGMVAPSVGSQVSHSWCHSVPSRVQKQCWCPQPCLAAPVTSWSALPPHSDRARVGGRGPPVTSILSGDSSFSAPQGSESLSHRRSHPWKC